MFDIKTLYSLETLNNWKENKIAQFNEKNMQIEEEYFWKVRVYDVKTVFFNNNMWRNVLECSKRTWNEIIEERQLTDQELINKYQGKLEFICNSNDNSNNDSQITKKFKIRNIRKKISNKQLIDIIF